MKTKLTPILPGSIIGVLGSGQLGRMFAYGLNKVRFVSPVPAGAMIRSRVTLQSLEEIPGGRQLTWNATIEREGGEKPCCVAEWLVRQYF